MVGLSSRASEANGIASTISLAFSYLGSHKLPLPYSYMEMFQPSGGVPVPPG